MDFIRKHKIIVLVSTLIVIVGVALVFRLGALKVSYTNPKSGTKDISTDTEIDIFFNREIKDNEKAQISVDISPQEDLSFLFSKSQLKIVPKNPLKTATTYSLDIKVNKRKISSFSFETLLFTPEQIAKEGLLQSRDDLAFGEVYKKFLSDFPWYLSLPIEKSTYRIVYDFEKKSFRIRFKIALSAKQEETLINQALEELKKIGVPEPISYYTLKAE